MNIFGKKHFSKNLEESGIIDVSFLISGHYIIKIIQKNKSIDFVKFIKL